MRNFFSINQKIPRCSAMVLLAAMLAVLAGCGGGSPASTSSTTTTTPPVATAATVQLLVSSPQMPSSGATPIDLTAVVLSATSQAVAGRTVTFSVGTDSTAFINNIGAAGVSDANGLVTAKLNLGANKTNRTISLTATVDGVAGTNSVDVTGTAITVSGSNSLSFGATTTLIFNVKDSAGVPLPNVAMTLASQTGNTIVPTPATGITTSAGQITATVTALRAGNDVITASAAGASKTQALTISSATLVFNAPALAAGATTIQIPLNTSTPVSVTWTSNGVPVAGQVSFSATRGAISGSPATTGASGNAPGVAGATILSASAGPAIISASGPGGTPAATLNVVFVATSASTVTPQASPGTVQPTTTSASQTNNTSTISAMVRDADGNLVQNARVNFTITVDPSGGSLSAPSAITDASGTASVTYTAGGTSSPQNGVAISATVVDINGVTVTPVGPTSVTLTVGGAALFVRLGTDNLVGTSPTNSSVYTKTYTALVTDSAGNPVPANTEVRFVLRPDAYKKGSWSVSGTVWVQTVNVTCANEDQNFNGIVNSGEDTNGNGRLDPGNVAVVNGTATTNANGFATATLSYSKDYAHWAAVVLEARAGVVGNDPPSRASFVLLGLAADYSDKDVFPPGRISPFGTSSSCTDTQ